MSDRRESGTTPMEALVRGGFVERIPDVENEYAVTDGRAETLRAQWQAITAAWLNTVDNQTAEEWAETFASEHPEWFEENAA